MADVKAPPPPHRSDAERFAELVGNLLHTHLDPIREQLALQHSALLNLQAGMTSLEKRQDAVERHAKSPGWQAWAALAIALIDFGMLIVRSR